MTRRSFVGATGAVALGAATGGISTGSAKSRPELPIPAELRADADGTIALAAQKGTMSFVSAGPTPTYGFNGDYLGPAVRVKRGESVRMEVTNALDQDITTHWHGLIVPGEEDGGPHQIIKPGKTWRPRLAIDQPAATLWFHPHIYPTTAELVVRGLAGLFIVDDEEAGALPLPSTWGVDDIPLIIQDRRFEADGSIFHRFNLAAVTVGYVGDMVLVNGAMNPTGRTARGWLRLRILNGCNARTLRIAASDGRDLHVVGSDGGLLAAPVTLKDLTLHAGERFEVLVDARDGTPFDIVSLPFDGSPIMLLPPFDAPLSVVTLDPSGADGKGTLPDALVSLPALPDTLPEVSHHLTMDMNLDSEGMSALMKAGLKEVMDKGGPPPAAVKALTALIADGPELPLEEQLAANGVNGKSYSLDMKTFDVPVGKALRWRIEEGSDKMLHPVHVHGCQFRIVSMDGKPPAPHLAGWKDTAAISAGGSAEILVTFPLKAPPQAPDMAHCHILEHEDAGMMTQFSVS